VEEELVRHDQEQEMAVINDTGNYMWVIHAAVSLVS
jgi:hypothetical protein